MKKNLWMVLLLAVVTTGSYATDGKTYSLRFDGKNFVASKGVLNGKTVNYRACKNVVYVSHPVDTQYESMNVFVPEAYFSGGTVNGYTRDTAPIFLPNQVGGYMPATPGDIGGGGMRGGMPPFMRQDKGNAPSMGQPGGPGDAPAGAPPMPQGDRKSGAAQRLRLPGGNNTILAALARGYVVVSPGARGRTLQDKDGKYYGKAPAFVVDMKAAVRYLRYNDQLMPGNAERIISNGTSAGGALSALLGASGDSRDYAPYLQALGAADASDATFAVSAYCPITNLDHADAAYEWLFCDANADKSSVSAQLRDLFIPYVNSLQLKAPDGTPLTLDAEGKGTFRDYVKSFVMASAQKALGKGTDLSKISWLTIKDGKVTTVDFDQYVKAIQRMKSAPAFDAFDLSTPETIEFGTEKVDAQHFTAFGMQHSTVKATMADAQIVRMMNPMSYIGTSDAKPAKHWRIRHGTIDRDGSIAVPIILATRLQDCGYDVNVALPWNTPHSGDYDLDELFSWIDSICK